MFGEAKDTLPFEPLERGDRGLAPHVEEDQCEEGVDAEMSAWSTPVPEIQHRRLGLTTATLLGGVLFLGGAGIALCMSRSRAASRTADGVEPALAQQWESSLGDTQVSASNSGSDSPLSTSSSAPLKEFYVYRAYAAAQGNEAMMERLYFGNFTARSLESMMNWLKREVVATFSNRTRCPREHNITRIKRFRMRTRATQELFDEGMNMGTLFNYQGKCLGRCFPDGFCTGERDCADHYEKYGYFAGCNTSHGRYSFPLPGRCDFPTGSHNCTWSFEDAGEVSLELLEASAPSHGLAGNCCNGKCTMFWDQPDSVRAKAALDMFAMMYLEQPRDFSNGQSPCDFRWNKWYAKDTWQDIQVETEPDSHEAVTGTTAMMTTVAKNLVPTTMMTTVAPNPVTSSLATWAPTTVPPNVSHAPFQEFYIYRATQEGPMTKYPFGNVNAGNLDGVIWYLQNEVVTMYTNGTRCPRKFNISTIRRFKFRMRTTNDLYDSGLNYGARFSFDRGKCVGRCFPNNMCTVDGDCEDHYSKYGYIVGCNNFEDKYPFPADETPTPQGIWYSLPLEGRCGYPTGARDCTWSYEEAGEVPLELLEASFPGSDNCCNGVCTDFWTGLFDEDRALWRVEQTKDMFKMMYPEMPRELGYPPCDFKAEKWYPEDKYDRVDPWADGGIMYQIQ
jgi:hypothetical protein